MNSGIGLEALLDPITIGGSYDFTFELVYFFFSSFSASIWLNLIASSSYFYSCCLTFSYMARDNAIAFYISNRSSSFSLIFCCSADCLTPFLVLSAWIAAIYSYLFLETIIFLKAKKLSHNSTCWNILWSFLSVTPLMMHCYKIFSGIPAYSVIDYSSKAHRPTNCLWILVYSNLFYSESSKIRQFYSMKSSRGFLQIGEIRYCLTKS